VRRAGSSLRGPCSHCGTQSSSQWRSGPPEKPCLCNACGLFWSKRRSLPEETCKVADELKVGRGADGWLAAAGGGWVWFGGWLAAAG
jgi:hypothetical protein